MHAQQPEPAHPDQTNQAPQPAEQPFPTATALLIAVILSLSRWLDWILRNTTTIVTSPRFTRAVKDAGVATIPVLQKIAREAWTWYTTMETDKVNPAIHYQQPTVPCNTSQTLSFGVSMPGVSINMQYQATNVPVLPATPDHLQAGQARQAVIESHQRLPIEANQPRPAGSAATTIMSPTPPISLLHRACNSVASVSNLPLQTLALVPSFTPLHPVRVCANVWNASRAVEPEVAQAQ